MLNAEQQKLCVFTITLAESRAGGAAAGGFASFLPRRARRNRMRDVLDAEQFSTVWPVGFFYRGHSLDYYF